MKKAILFFLLFNSVYVNAQSLKEALYGGKLKNEPGTVIRKGDDLSAKIDTTTRIASTDSSVAKTNLPVLDSTKKTATSGDSTVIGSLGNTYTATTITDTATSVTATSPALKNTTITKDNAIVWKEYITAVTNTLKTEVLPSKKIKKGTYYVSVSYAIDTVGQVAINNVIVTPENAYLQQQIKDRIAVDVPRMTPTLSSSGAPRKVNKNYNFSLNKD
ncbi:MAG TPA: hypothetical protein VM888_15290 [Chitinophagaceae bacterium]|jgi:hypothetical protein|nr:hypothetical protein [Chitinophagaceae bacterium]